MRIHWEGIELKSSSFIDVAEMQVLSFAEQKLQVCDDDDDMPKNRANRKLMASTIAAHPYLLLRVEHDVQVVKSEETNARVRQGSGGSACKKRLSRVFHLLNIASKMIAVYCGSGAHFPSSTFLSCHRNAMPCTFIVSQFLRELCEKFVSETSTNGLSWLEDDSALTTEPVRGIRLLDVLPSRSKQKEYLNANILRVTEAEFKLRCTREWKENRSTGALDTFPGGKQIAVNEADNVFNIA